jgi:hypothetical protein
MDTAGCGAMSIAEPSPARRRRGAVDVGDAALDLLGRAPRASSPGRTARRDGDLGMITPA